MFVLGWDTAKDLAGQRTETFLSKMVSSGQSRAASRERPLTDLCDIWGTGVVVEVRVNYLHVHSLESFCWGMYLSQCLGVFRQAKLKKNLLSSMAVRIVEFIRGISSVFTRLPLTGKREFLYLLPTLLEKWSCFLWCSGEVLSWNVGTDVNKLHSWGRKMKKEYSKTLEMDISLRPVSVLVKDSIGPTRLRFFLNIGELFCVRVKYSTYVLGN